MSQEAFNILKGIYPTARMASKGYIRVPCPTCDKHDARKSKRYVNPVSLNSNCYICETPLTWGQLTGKSTMPEGTTRHALVVEPKKEHKMAKVIPCYGQPTPVNKLPNDHPCVKFLAKDHLFDLDYYANKLGWVYVPTGQGELFNASPLITSEERLVFPVYFKHQLVGWQMRSIPGTPFGDRAGCVKYYHLFNKGQYLYNYDEAKKYPMVVVTEGVKKALKFPSGVATWGKGISDQQLQLLQEWKNIVFFLDGEDETQELAKNFMEQLLLVGHQVINIDPRKYGVKSPDEAPAEIMHAAVYAEFKEKYNEL